ncbi:hypothetical protein [Reyranella sp.]|uniref:hypothetical protein n=1 Tax=Reyranella sp. TaxID=1929291 RepID=UPI003C7A2D0E
MTDVLVGIVEIGGGNADGLEHHIVLVANHGDKMRPMLSQFFQGQGAGTGPVLDYSKGAEGGGK